MKRRIANQRGMSMIGLLASLAVIIIIAFMLMRRSGMMGDAIKGKESAKNKAMGMECNTVITSLGTQAKVKQTMNQPYESMDELVQEQPSLRHTVENTNLWVEDGNPVLEYVSDDEYVISGYCVDGNLYQYSSTEGSLPPEPWE
jgi:type II secretory pathway pseudopilin PulG